MEKIVLYSRSTCPKCKVLKKKLDDSGLKYEVVEDDIQKMIELGAKEAPLLVVGEKVLGFKDATTFVNQAKEAC